MEKENIITNYIAVWSWHIIAVISLFSGLILWYTAVAHSYTSIIFAIVALVSSIFCEFMSYYRRKSIYKEEDEQKSS